MEIATAVPASNDGGGGGTSPAERSSADAINSSSSPSASSSSGLSTDQVTRKDLNSLASRFDDDEEEEDVCRICRNPGEADNPLRYPCACSGSIKYVHQDCLLQWLNHSNARQCEVCKHAFSFSPVYAENAPARLPFQEFVVGMAMKACHVLQFFLRLSFVLSVWLLIIPFITFWIWRLAFVRSFGEAHRLFLGHLSTTIILTDCLHGFLLSASIVFIFLGATSLRDYFRHLRELGGQEADREDDGDRNAARAPRRPVAPANRNFAADANEEDANGAQGIAGAGQLIRRNAENVAARWEMQAARLEAHVEQMFDGLDDADGAEDVPFDELVGMQGPVFHLVENAFTVLASNMIFLGVVIFVPFSLGRIILYYLSWILSSASNPVLSTVMPLTETALSLANITLKSAWTAVANLTPTANEESSLLGQVTEMLKANATELSEAANNLSTTVSTDLLKGSSVGTSRLSDVTTLAVGYMFIFSLVFFYLGIVALIRYTRGEPLTLGRFYGIASIAETIPSLFRQFVAAMRHLMTMIKVAFLLVIELGVFPLMCGWWLDVCTIRMFGKSITQRVEFFSVSPLASSLVHWVVGIVYMLQISIFVSLLRGVLRNGVLYFLRDPADPNYNPFRDLIDDPVHKHARRVLLSVAVYGSLIVMLVYLPVKLAMRMAPSIFPLDISVSDPFTEIPADMLLFQICIPFAIEHFKLRTTIKSLLRYWFTAVGWSLGLTDFLLPRPEDNGRQENGNGDQGRQDRFQAPHGVPDRALVGFAPDNRGRHAAASSNFVEDYDNEEQADPDRYAFVLRIVLLLVVAWMTLLLFNSALIIVPISLGRALFNSLPLLPITHGIKCNDLYAFVIGSYAIWTAIAGARYSIDQVRTRRVAALMNQIWKWCVIVLKSSALLSIWIFIIPVLIGLLFELLVIVPMRVPIDESPVFLLYQDWALGLIFLKIWTRLVMLDHMMPLVDESWRLKFERVRENGFSRLQGFWVLREIVLPIIMKLLTALCVPEGFSLNGEMATFTFSLCFLLFLFVLVHPSSSSSSFSPYLYPSTFSMNYDKMLTSFKVFIYPTTQRIIFFSPSASNFYESLINSAFITQEPEEADLFFVVFSPEISSRSQARLVRELRTKYPYWNRTLGADHFFISPEGIDFSSDRNALELKKNSVQISVFPTVSGKFIPHKDISLSPVSKSSLVLSHAPVNMDRSCLGYLKWDGKTEAELVEELRLDSEFVVETEPLDQLGRVKSSKFCLFFYEAESTLDLTEAMAAGCVPVVIVDRPVQDFPLMDVLRWSEMSLLIGNRRGGQGLKAVLSGVPEDRYERMRGLCVAAAHHMVWNAEPQAYDAFHMVMYQLWMRRHTIRYTRREEF